MLATIRSRLRRAAQRGQVKRASAAYVVTDGIIRAARACETGPEPRDMPCPGRQLAAATCRPSSCCHVAGQTAIW